MSDNRKRSYEDGDRDHFKKERKSGKVVKILCPYYCTGAIIGTKGASINQIQQESNTSIQVSKGAARFPRTDERVISISGDLEGLLTVINFVQEKIRTEKPSPQAKGVRFDKVDGRKRLCKIVVSDQSIGKLIGKGGANVNRLKDENNVKIHMMKPADAIPGLNERTVTVQGEDKDVDNCIREIVTEVFEDERGILDYNLDYSNFQENFNQGYREGYQYGNHEGGNSYHEGGFRNQGSSYGNNYYDGYDNRGSVGYRNQNPHYQNSGYDNQMYNQPTPDSYSSNQPYRNQGFGSQHGGGHDQTPVNYSDNPGQGGNAGGNYGQSHYGSYY